MMTSAYGERLVHLSEMCHLIFLIVRRHRSTIFVRPRNAHISSSPIITGGFSGYSRRVCRRGFLFCGDPNLCAPLVLGWSVARVGEVQAYAGSAPTILEHLLYWISSSMHEPGTYHRPEVGSERVLPSEECPCVVYDVMAKNPRAALALCLLD